MLNIPTNALLKPRNDADDSEILFLADRSGSMDDKIPALKSAMQFFLKGLPPKLRFNIWSFGSEFSSLWPKSKAYSRETLNEAERHVRKEFDANLGGTELLPALKEIFKSRSTTGTATTDIIILTDGEVWREEETIEFINSARKHSSYSARFFCLGIGPAVSHSLVEGIAKTGGGYAEVVPASQKSGWEDRIVRMLKAALHNHIGPIQLKVGENTANGFRQWKTSSFLQTPAATTSFSPFVTNRVFLLFEDSGVPVHRAVIALKTNGANGKEGTHFLKPTASDEPDLLLHTLAARGLLQDLETGQSQKHQDHASGHAIRREGERISCTYSLLSKWTCFIAVEEDQRSDNILSDIIQESIAAICKLEPSGWNPDLQRNIGRIPKGQYLLDATSADRSSDSESGGESGSYNDSDNESDDSRDEPPPPPPPPPPTNGNGPSKGSGSGSGSSSGSGSGTSPSSGRGSGPSPSGNGSDPNTSGSNSGATDGAGNSNGASMNSRATGSDSSGANHSGAGPSDLGSLQLNTNGRQAIASLDSRSLLAGQTKPEISHEVGLQDGRKGPPFHKNIEPKVLRNILLRVIETNAPPSTPSLEIPSYWADEEERACLKSTEMPCIVVPAHDPNVGARTKYPYSSMPPLHNSPQLNHWQRNSHPQNWAAQPTVQPKSQQISQPTSQPTSYSTAYSTAYPTSQPLETILYLPRDRISQSQAPQDTYQTALSATERFIQETARYDEVPVRFGNANHAIDGAGVIRRLIQLQDFDGGFNASPQNPYMLTQPPLHELFGRNFSILYSYIETLMENVSYSQYSLGKSEIISTVAVLAILRSHLSGYKDMWILLEERAERYLGTRLNSVEELVSSAFEKAKFTNFEFTSHGNSSFPIYPPYPPHPYSGVSLDLTNGDSLNSYGGYGGNPITSDGGYDENLTISDGGYDENLTISDDGYDENPRNLNIRSISPSYHGGNPLGAWGESPLTPVNITSTSQSSQTQGYQAQGPFEQTMPRHIM